jgi:hypothetical protein
VWEASMIVAARWVSVVALGFRNSEFWEGF